MSNTIQTIDEIVHNINIGYYLDNGGEESAVAAIEAYKDNACIELLDRLKEAVNVENVQKKYGYHRDEKVYGYRLAVADLEQAIEVERTNLKSEEEKLYV